jgi:hypothetical protein
MASESYEARTARVANLLEFYKKVIENSDRVGDSATAKRYRREYQNVYSEFTKKGQPDPKTGEPGLPYDQSENETASINNKFSAILKAYEGRKGTPIQRAAKSALADYIVNVHEKHLTSPREQAVQQGRKAIQPTKDWGLFGAGAGTSAHEQNLATQRQAQESARIAEQTVADPTPFQQRSIERLRGIGTDDLKHHEQPLTLMERGVHTGGKFVQPLHGAATTGAEMVGGTGAIGAEGQSDFDVAASQSADTVIDALRMSGQGMFANNPALQASMATAAMNPMNQWFEHELGSRGHRS